MQLKSKLTNCCVWWTDFHIDNAIFKAEFNFMGTCTCYIIFVSNLHLYVCFGMLQKGNSLQKNAIAKHIAGCPQYIHILGQ